MPTNIHNYAVTLTSYITLNNLH